MAIVVMMIIMMVRVVVAMFSADVLTVNPVSVVRHVTGNPDHLIVALPIVRAMVIVRLVANVDLNSTRSKGGRKKNARHQNGSEQQFAFNHRPTDHATINLANTVSVARHTV